MENDYKQLLSELTDIKTKIAIADFFISNFKQQDVYTLEKIELLKTRLDVLDTKLQNELRDIDVKIVQRIVIVEQTLTNLNAKIDNVSNNAFLNFTNNLDPKKWAAIVSIIISFMLGNGVVDNVISDNIDPRKDNINQNVEKLVEELLIKQQSTQKSQDIQQENN